MIMRSSIPVSVSPLFCSLLLLLLVSLAPPAVSGYALAKSDQPDCVELICQTNGRDRLGLLAAEDFHENLVDQRDGKALDKCRKCEDCTNSGYSVCVQPRQFDPVRRTLLDASGESCECAHSGPEVADNTATLADGEEHKCRVLTGANSLGHMKSPPSVKPGEMLFRACFSTALRKIPSPDAKNEELEDEGAAVKDEPTPVLVTVNQFWQSDYWHSLQLEQLRLVYVFPVTKDENCDGKVDTPGAHDLMWINSGKSRDEIARQKTLNKLCTASQQINMGKMEEVEEGQKDDEDYLTHQPVVGQQQNGTEGGGGEVADYIDQNIDESLPPEVLFERNVFAGAEKVQFFYELTVHRKNQLKLGAGGRLKFESRTTKVRSEPLVFNLHPEIHGTGMSSERGQPPVVTAAGGRSASSKYQQQQRGVGGELLPTAGAAGSRGKIEKVGIAERNRQRGEERARQQPAGKAAAEGDGTGENEPIVRPTVGDSEDRKSTTPFGEQPAESTRRKISITSSSSRGQQQRVRTTSAPPVAVPNAPPSSPRRHPSAGVLLQEPTTLVPVPSSFARATDPPMLEPEGKEVGPADRPKTTKGGGGSAEEAGAAEDLMVWKVLALSLISLAFFISLAYCYKQSICCFGEHRPPSQGTANGKTRIQNGKEYREAKGGHPGNGR